MEEGDRRSATNRGTALARTSRALSIPIFLHTAALSKRGSHATRSGNVSNPVRRPSFSRSALLLFASPRFPIALRTSEWARGAVDVPKSLPTLPGSSALPPPFLPLRFCS